MQIILKLFAQSFYFVPLSATNTKYIHLSQTIMSALNGHISQIIGPVVDVHFELSESQEFKMPAIDDALYVKRPDGQNIFLEVQHHIGENIVRTVAMESTDGLSRGLPVKALGRPIKIGRASCRERV